MDADTLVMDPQELDRKLQDCDVAIWKYGDVLGKAARGEYDQIQFPEGTGPLIPTNPKVKEFLDGVRQGLVAALKGLADWIDRHVPAPPREAEPQPDQP